MTHTVRIYSVFAVFMLLLAFLCFNKTLYSQIVSNVEVPFIEEPFLEETPNEPVSTAKPEIEYVPIATIRDLNLPAPCFHNRCYSEIFLNMNSNNRSTLVIPPLMTPNASVSTPSKIIMPEEYLSRVASSHPWGRFPDGSWKRFHIIKETISCDSKHQPITHQVSMEYTETLTLSEKSSDQFCLIHERAYGATGRRWKGASEITESNYNYWEENASLKLVDFKTKQDSTLELEGITYPCFWEQVIFEDQSKRVEIKTWRSDNDINVPQVLKQERVIYDKRSGKNEQLSARSTYQIFPTAFPYPIMGGVYQVWKIEKIEETSQEKSVTTSLISLTIPGEYVSWNTCKYNKNGDLIGKITCQILGFGIQCSGSTPEQSRKPILPLRSGRRFVQPFKGGNGAAF